MEIKHTEYVRIAKLLKLKHIKIYNINVIMFVAL